ncbi:uncharacterized protein DEA37_0011602 [Paragonimus westermani]|uniref:Uncharacterized protein n=1 Tax=Paragonimus westermani TaxID=34504 RepID=A0A5J4NAJ1_9TREM|nr:uncharacterized protein DEA37_0011602 [Paragonimus westermani]
MNSIGSIVKLQALIRGFLVRTRLRKALKAFDVIAIELGDTDARFDWINRTACSMRSSVNVSKRTAALDSLDQVSLTDLYHLRKDLFLEMVWLDQAIKSRSGFLNYKQNFAEALNN